MLGNGASGPSSVTLCLRPGPSAACSSRRRVVASGRPGVHEIAGTSLVDPVLRIGVPVRVRHRIEVVQVSKVLVEAVHCRRELVEIAEMVLAELSGFMMTRILGLPPAGRWAGTTAVSNSLTRTGAKLESRPHRRVELGKP